MGELIRDLAVRRQIIAMAGEAIAAARSGDPVDTASAQVERLERGLFDLAETGTVGSGFLSSADMLKQTLAAAEAAHMRNGALTGLSTGLTALDALLGGLHRSDLVILAGRPGMGKTALATNIAFSAARSYRVEKGSRIEGGVVGFFSLEMSAEQVMTRIVAEQVGVSSERVRRGQLTSAEMDRLMSVSETSADYRHVRRVGADEGGAGGVGHPCARSPIEAAAWSRPDRGGLPAALRERAERWPGAGGQRGQPRPQGAGEGTGRACAGAEPA
jgi:replicative DNA helicase